MIASISNVKDFFTNLAHAGINIHPDDDFKNLINLKTGLPTFTEEVATEYNEYMNQCFSVCEKSGEDIYDLMYSVYLKETELGILIN